jgi:hypothetical protein
VVVTPFAPADDANVSNNAIPSIELTPNRRRAVATSLVTRLPMSRPTSTDRSATAEATEVRTVRRTGAPQGRRFHDMSGRRGLRDGWGNAPVTDEIAFRRVETHDMGDNPEQRVEAVISGQTLAELLDWGDNWLPLDVYIAGQNLDRWAPGGDDSNSPYVEDGRVAVLTCGCGDFGCGGATARIIFTADRVIWTDFHGASHRDRVAARPFVFSRPQYTAALESWSWANT